MKAYKEYMPIVFSESSYYHHATSLLHELRKVMARIPGEILMLSDASFYPISCQNWVPKNDQRLFDLVNKDMRPGASEIGNFKPGTFDYESWSRDWAMPNEHDYWGQMEGPYDLDLSETYVIHAYHSQFRRHITEHVIKDYGNHHPSRLRNGLTIPLILEGNSNFARATLSIVQHALEHGVISV